MIIGLTGGIGSGKTTVANFFLDYKGVVVYIADLEAKKIMNSSGIIKEKLVAEFGKESYKDNQLNRKFISEIVFKNKNKLAILNSIVHPEVKKHFHEFVKSNSDKKYIIYENAILFESKSNLFCDFVITVYADIETKIKRVMLRDSLTKFEVIKRVNNQWKEEKKLLQSNYIIFNSELDNTKEQVNRIHKILTEKALKIM